MKQSCQAASPEALLLAAAALVEMKGQDDDGQIRAALQAALHSSNWRKPLKFEARIKRQALNLLEAWFGHSGNKFTENLIRQYPWPPLDSPLDEALLRLLLFIFSSGDSEALSPKDFFAVLPDLAKDASAVIASFQFYLIAQSLKLSLVTLCTLAENETEDALLEKKIKATLEKTGVHANSLPARFALRLILEILPVRQMLDERLEWFARSSHELPNLEERQFWRLALFILSGEKIGAKILRKALEAVFPYTFGEKQKKFFRIGLRKAVNSRSRELAFQTLYAFSYDWPDDSGALERRFASIENLPEIFDSLSNGQPDGLSWKLARGVWEKLPDLDNQITKFSQKWRKERLGRIELLLLRMGLYEMESGLTPPKVVISEVLDLANLFGVPEATGLINGILDAAIKAEKGKA